MKYCAIILIAVGTLSLPAQDEQGEVRTRRIWDLNLQQKRVEARKSATEATHKKSGATVEAKTANDDYIGVTLWRFRPSRGQDAPSARLLVHDPDSDTEAEWTPERSMASAPLREGQKVRLSIESARQGYLYVIDREQYADGSFGDAEMIFPTQKMRHSSNQVQAGRVVDIPATGDGSFRVQRSRKDQVAEELTILVCPTPLEGVKIGIKPLAVSKEQLAEWKKSWGAAFKQLEERDAVGRTYTQAERDASDKGTLLGDTDPLPQTMFEVKAAPGNPLMVTMPLRIE